MLDTICVTVAIILMIEQVVLGHINDNFVLTLW